MPKKEEENVIRVPIPKGKQMFAVVEQRLGYSKMYVRCADGKIRIGRIPGKFARRLWVREGDLVLIEPWPVQGDKKCDIIYRYTAAQKEWLIRQGYLPEDFA